MATVAPAMAQETQTEREAARGVLQKMDALERSIDVPALVTSLRAPNAKQSAISDLLRRINERLWLGHFDYWNDEGVAVFRHTIPMLDRIAPDPGEIAAVLQAALDAADQFLPAFNFVVWAGKSAEEAVTAVAFETHGEA
jgi:hypothetical protein